MNPTPYPGPPCGRDCWNLGPRDLAVLADALGASRVRVPSGLYVSARIGADCRTIGTDAVWRILRGRAGRYIVPSEDDAPRMAQNACRHDPDPKRGAEALLDGWRRFAETVCPRCSRLIGWDARYYIVDDAMVHARCFERDTE